MEGIVFIPAYNRYRLGRELMMSIRRRLQRDMRVPRPRAAHFVSVAFELRPRPKLREEPQVAVSDGKRRTERNQEIRLVSMRRRRRHMRFQSAMIVVYPLSHRRLKVGVSLTPAGPGRGRVRGRL